jgi:uncharacterized membrane-anchored protein
MTIPNMRKVLIIAMPAAAIAALAITTASAYAANDAGNDATAREIAALHWQAGPIEAPDSHSKITPRPGFMGVTGVEAHRVRELGDSVVPPGVEADVVDVGNGDEIVYQYLNEDFVSIEDWADVNADAMLAGLKENDNKSNAVRREHGVPEAHVTGWIERPSLNRDTNTVSWIIEGVGGRDGTKFINAVALKLGRNGFERITWITDPNSLSAIAGWVPCGYQQPQVQSWLSLSLSLSRSRRDRPSGNLWRRRSGGWRPWGEAGQSRWHWRRRRPRRPREETGFSDRFAICCGWFVLPAHLQAEASSDPLTERGAIRNRRGSDEHAVHTDNAQRELTAVAV